MTGIDIGYVWIGGHRTEGVGIRIHVNEKLPHRHVSRLELFPRWSGGVRVDVLKARYVKNAAGRRDRLEPIQPGISTGHPGTTAGTLGLFVKDASGARFALSSAHVLVPDNFSHPGDAIVQPGRAHGGRVPADSIAVVERFDRPTDSAIARLQNARSIVEAQFKTGVVLTGVRLPVLGEALEKSSLGSDVTTAVVDGIEGPYEGITNSFRLVPRDGSGDIIARGGDSGGIWYSAATREAIGLHCLGPPRPVPEEQFAVATRLVDVFARLGVGL